MQSIKDKMGHTSGEGPNSNNQNFIARPYKSAGSPTPGSTTTPMAPAGSFRTPSRFRFGFAKSTRLQLQTFDEQPPNPYVQHGQASFSPSASPIQVKGDATDHSNLRSIPVTYHPPNDYEGSQPWQEQQQQQQFTRGGGGGGPREAPAVAELGDEELLTREQVLVAIPGAVTHLVKDDDGESTIVHLASGEFSLVRITQEKSEESVVIAKVGEQLKWHLVQDASSPTVKVDATHYFFTLQVPRELTAADQRVEDTTEKHQMDNLYYGLTLPAVGSGSDDDDEHAARTRTCALDYFLERYSKFWAPTVVKGIAASEVHHQQAEEEKGLVPVDDDGKLAAGQDISPETTISGDDGKRINEESGAAFWTTVAPNVDDYTSKCARYIAKGVGGVIEDIFMLSDSTMAKMDSGRGYIVSKVKPKTQPSNVGTSTINGARSARKLTAKTDKVVGGIVEGVVHATNGILSAMVNSRHGQKFFKTSTGEVALVSLDAAVTISDAIEEAGKNILSRASSVTQEVVNHRYGDSASQLTDESLRSAGHALSVAWSITNILDIDPKIRRELAGKANTRPARPNQLDPPDQQNQPAQPTLDTNPYVQHC